MNKALSIALLAASIHALKLNDPGFFDEFVSGSAHKKTSNNLA